MRLPRATHRVLLTKDRWEAKNTLYDAQNFLTRQLKLRLNPNPIIKHYTGGFVFLKEAGNILQRLLFLSPKNRDVRAQVIAKLVKETFSRKASQSTPSPSETQSPPATTGGPLATEIPASPPTVKKVISKKRREYQKLQAKAAELIVSTHGVFIGKSRRGIVIKKKRQKLKEVSSLNLKHILLLTDKVSLSGSLIKYCAENKIALDFLSFDGQSYARLVSPVATSSMLGLRQLEALVNGKGKSLAGDFDPHISFLHKQQGDKPALVFHLVEEFRQQAVDRVVFSMITKGEKLTMEGDKLAPDTKKKLVENVLERLNTSERFRGQMLTLNEIIRYQARRMAKFLDGAARSYRPYVAKW